MLKRSIWESLFVRVLNEVPSSATVAPQRVGLLEETRTRKSRLRRPDDRSSSGPECSPAAAPREPAPRQAIAKQTISTLKLELTHPEKLGWMGDSEIVNSAAGMWPTETIPT